MGRLERGFSSVPPIQFDRLYIIAEVNIRGSGDVLSVVPLLARQVEKTPRAATELRKERPRGRLLRSVRLVAELERSWAKPCDRGDFRLAHYSIQGNQHLLVEAKDTDALGRGMKALGARLARAVNRVFRRRGPVLRARYHHVVLKSPTQVRNALRYVLMNARHHSKRPGRTVRIDPASSGRWFEGWKHSARAILAEARERPGIHAVATPHTWLLNEGWKKAGPLLDPAASPG